MEKVILTIDPGSPSGKREKSATTGVVVGTYFTPSLLETKSFTIESANVDQDEDACARGIKEIYDKYSAQGFEVVVVMEEFINYSYMSGIKGFQKNATSELIGKIKFALTGVDVQEQSTSQIKSKYPNEILVNLGVLEKVGREYKFTEQFDSERRSSNRHERDALRHYLLCRDKKGMYNYVGEFSWD